MTPLYPPLAAAHRRQEIRRRRVQVALFVLGAAGALAVAWGAVCILGIIVIGVKP